MVLNIIKRLLGLGPKTDYKELMKNGAQIIDVRTSGEFHSGHIKGSVNIPLQQLSANIKKIKKDKPIITCCASGMRSASAKSILKSNGFAEVYNGGGWASLQQKL
ncbi:MAG TPA: rhodanese-like domain-containing protein [Flavipsychrobacter sp.]|jgi:rhodanese-related sulfurtransferase|nr:rhodanese-like domain-containing protein [Flavipsychrobacter sp.]